MCSSASLAVSQTMVMTVNFTAATMGAFPISGRATFNDADTNTANNLFVATTQVKERRVESSLEPYRDSRAWSRREIVPILLTILGMVH
jgi:hypothetical protein